MTDKTDIAALRKAALKATKGEWRAFTDIRTGTCAVHTPEDKGCGDIVDWPGFDGAAGSKKQKVANAKYIALANPATIIALLDKLEAERQRADTAEAERNTALKQASAARIGFDEQYQLREKAEKERDELLNQEFQQRLANAEHQLYMKELAIYNVRAQRKAQFKRRKAVEAENAELRAKLANAVVLEYRKHDGFTDPEKVRLINAVIDRCAAAIKESGFTVKGE